MNKILKAPNAAKETGDEAKTSGIKDLTYLVIARPDGQRDLKIPLGEFIQNPGAMPGDLKNTIRKVLTDYNITDQELVDIMTEIIERFKGMRNILKMMDK